jgi:cysteine synthase
MPIVDNVLELIGSTPLVRLHRLCPNGAELVAKVEKANPGGSVKDRIALAMVEAAERDGLLKPGGTIVEATSGNTGIGLAMIAAVKGYRCIIAMPDDMSLERRYILKSFGAQVVVTPAIDGMNGAVSKAEEITRSTPGSFMPRQFKNSANPSTHYRTTGPELWEATGGRIDALVCGVGTGGTLSGAGRYLREKNPGILLVAVEPAASAVLSGCQPAVHGIQGLGPGFVPDTLDRTVISRIAIVSDAEAKDWAGRIAREEGLFVGTSSGAATAVAVRVASELGPGHRVAVVLPDGGDRYVFA